MAAGQGKQTGAFDGPGNKTIATALLEWLSVQGRSAARDRAARALGEEGQDLSSAGAWLEDEAAIPSLFAAGEIEPGLARAIGHRLVSADAAGLKLYGLGLATPEKAYRRVQSLLPRDAAKAAWTVDKIEERVAKLRFDAPSGPTASGRVAASLCALRMGMLEAVPGLYGLLPASVEESTCVARGDDACRYDVRWQATLRVGTKVGAALGLGAAAAIVSVILSLGQGLTGAGLGLSVFAAGLCLALGPTLGGVYDLRRQLEAVAGARRGHLALFDQVDDALAEKLDALARADAKLENEPAPSPVRSAGDSQRSAAESDAAPSRDVQFTAQQIHAAAGDLECWFDGQGASEGVSDERGLVRDIREWAARLGRFGDPEGESPRSQVDLVRLVGRAVATVRPGLPERTVIKIDADPDLPVIECSPVQIEHVVSQLVQNAVEASVEISDAPEVDVRFKTAPRGVELVVTDRGVGIESSAIDEVFDPFFGERPAGAGHGLGLTVSLRIVERHGGELRIENQARAGTRVTVWLPATSPQESGAAENDPVAD